MGHPTRLRKKNNDLSTDARERYSQKHVRACFRLAMPTHERLQTPLGCSEIIPQQNPYLTLTGETIDVLCVK